MIRTYNDTLRGIAEFYWDAEEAGDIFGMALWGQWNKKIALNGGSEPEEESFCALLTKLDAASDDELYTLATNI